MSVPQQSSKSAGCLVIDRNKVLVIEGFTGKVSTPGGGSQRGESSRCTAHRETWEETGLDVTPGRLISVWRDDFHMYECDLHEKSDSLRPPIRFEVRRTHWLPVDRFDEFEWRFERQQAWLAEWMRARQ